MFRTRLVNGCRSHVRSRPRGFEHVPAPLVFLLFYIDSVASAESCETSLIAAADRIEFPLCSVLVELSEDDRRLDREILAQVISEDLLPRILIADADEGIGDLPEVLTSLLGLIDRDRKSDFRDICRDLREVNEDLLVVSLSGSGQVVTLMNDCSARMRQIAVEDEISG